MSGGVHVAEWFPKALQAVAHESSLGVEQRRTVPVLVSHLLVTHTSLLPRRPGPTRRESGGFPPPALAGVLPAGRPFSLGRRAFTWLD